MADRVAALAELPFIDVHAVQAGVISTWGQPDLLVASQGPCTAASPHGVGARVTPAVALDLVRVLLVNLGLYHVREHFTVDEGFYYTYRFKSVFRAYQPAWAAATFGKTTISEEVRDQLESLGTRLEFLCRAADRAAFFALRRANNDTQDNALYHLAYFVMLMTGMFDDLAWTLTYRYDLHLRRHDVVLKTAGADTSSRFLDALRSAAPDLASRIENPDVQKLVQVFYPLRDSLQHRQFLQGLLYVGGPFRVPMILFAFPETAVERLKAASADASGAEWGLRLADAPYVEPYTFITRSLAAAASVLDSILGAIDWAQLVGAPGDPARDATDASIARFHQSVAGFLDWHTEPLYF